MFPHFDLRTVVFTIPFVLFACGGSVESGAGTCTDNDPACAAQAPVTETSPTEPARGDQGGAGSSMTHTGTPSLANMVGDWDVAYATEGTCTNVPDAKPTRFTGEARVTLAPTQEGDALSASSDLWYACPGLELSPTAPFVSAPNLRGVCVTDTFTYGVSLDASTTPAKLGIAIHQSLGAGSNGKPAACDYSVTATAKKR